MHLRRGNQPLVLAAVGREGHTAVEKDFQIGPDFFEMRLAGEFHHALEHRHHPRRHAADVGHVLIHRLAGDAVALDFEVADQRRLFLRDTDQIGNRVDVLEHDGAHVADQRILDVEVRRVAAAQDEGLAVEDAAFGMVLQIIGQRIESAPVMRFLQPFPADGDEFRLVGGRAGRFGVPFHAAGPENVIRAVAHPVDVLLELLVGMEGHPGGKIFVSVHFRQSVTTAEFGIAYFIHQVAERLQLHRSALPGLPGQFLLPRYESQPDNLGQTHGVILYKPQN